MIRITLRQPEQLEGQANQILWQDSAKPHEMSFSVAKCLSQSIRSVSMSLGPCGPHWRPGMRAWTSESTSFSRALQPPVDPGCDSESDTTISTVHGCGLPVNGGRLGRVEPPSPRQCGIFDSKGL